MSAESVDCQCARLSVNKAGYKLPLTNNLIDRFRTDRYIKKVDTNNKSSTKLYLFLSLNTIGDKSAAGWGNAVGDYSKQKQSHS